jgi:ABC-type phosphate transport system substrate-binding protein
VNIAKLRAFGILVSMSAVAVAVTGVFAGSSPAAQKAAPAAGVGCVAKISGRGATFAASAVRAFARGFRDDICGAVGAGDLSFDGNTMVAYNWTGAPTGSGAGITNQKCRSESFGASDVPFFNADLAQFNGPLLAPGSVTCTGVQGFNPPFQPIGAPYPNASDLGSKNIMVFPIAGSAVGLGINLPAASCAPGVPQTQLQFTMDEVSKIYGGEYKTWPQVATATAPRNAWLSGCPVDVVRTARFDRSGTTQIFKNALAKAPHNVRSTSTCVPANDWAFYAQDAQNVVWPDSATSPDAACSDFRTAGVNGTGPLITLCSTTVGAICYGDIADLVATPALKRPNLLNATGATYVSPLSGLRANCNFSAVSPPGSGASGWVNQDPTDTWAVDNAAGNRGDVTYLGTAYPICGLTFGLVYTGLNAGSPTANPISRLTADQRRTLYAFFSYALSSIGQDRLNTVNYASLPTTAVAQIRAGFQSNY